MSEWLTDKLVHRGYYKVKKIMTKKYFFFFYKRWFRSLYPLRSETFLFTKYENILTFFQVEKNVYSSWWQSVFRELPLSVQWGLRKSKLTNRDTQWKHLNFKWKIFSEDLNIFSLCSKKQHEILVSLEKRYHLFKT